ncbi:MAG TPA: fumarylacetoacetate hydrolase family protein, partial [Gammaproteobacteria bacterium]|nr:fumarylacetoacetate hydrolase family protein [Gammaproteobacteria bacterium]
MKRLMTVLASTLLIPQALLAQQQSFKLGTFEDAGATYLGLVLDDARVVDIARANNALPGVKPAIPRDMIELIERYETLRPRLYAIAEAAASSAAQAPYVKDLQAVKILPPLRPNISYNAAANYSEHAAEMARRGGADPAATQTPPPNPIPGIWERDPGDTRQNPYIFLKAASTMIADGEAIRIPPQREQVDWECELAAVIARPASRVSPADAPDYIFGYTLHNDVSDRGGRGDGRMGSDWF